MRLAQAASVSGSQYCASVQRACLKPFVDRRIGQTTVDLYNSGGPITQLVLTRFVLTVTDAVTNAPVPLAFGQASPGVDVLASVPFRANLRMEARLNGATSFAPALDLFDALPTNPSGFQLAQTAALITSTAVAATTSSTAARVTMSSSATAATT